MSIRLLGTALIFSAATSWAAVASAQVETIDPNPTLPRDVGGRLTYRGFHTGGAALGRATGNEENPAEILLRSIEGTNYGRATGHSIFAPGQAQRAIGKDVRRRVGSSQRGDAEYYAQRGAYEDRVYQPVRGSYLSMQRQQTYYRTQVKQPVHRSPPEAKPKRDGRRTTERRGAQ